MNFTFENQGTHTYLVYTIAEDDAIDSMSLGMLTNNKIHGLAQTLFTQMDATKFIKYDVSAKISVKQFFTGQVNKKRLIGVFNGIVDAMLSAEDYMIDVNSILLDLDYIFADVSTCDTVLVCLPIVSDDLSNRDLGVFFKNIMFTTQFDQTENCDHVAKIINYLNSCPVFSLLDFKNLLDSIGGASAPVPVAQPAVQMPVQQPVQPAVQMPVQQPVQQRVQPVQQPMQQRVQPMPQASVQQPVPQKPVAQPVNQPPKVPVPPVQPRPMQTPPMQQPAHQPAPEKKMTMMGLLMHYNKENAELYKQQKAAAKKTPAAQTVAAPVPQQKKPQANAGFAIPGQSAPVNQGFAIPGQPTPVQRPAAPAPVQPMQRPAQPVQRPAQQPVQPAQRPVAPAPAPQPVFNQPVYAQPQMPQAQAMNFGETTVLGVGGGIGETTVLGASPAVQNRPHLIRTKNNEKIDLNKPVFRIGKERSYVDYFIGDNSAISRSHANIISRDGEYFVVDTNSTNHTYVNGQMIQSNVETKIAHGAKIKLANEDFEFNLY